MLYKLLIFILVLSFFTSCNKKEGVVYYDNNDFEKIIHLKSKKIEGVTQLTPSKICVFDSIIMVSDYLENPRFHFYDKKFNKVADYGYIGEGPEEYNSPECNCQTFDESNSNDKSIMLYEFGYGLVHKVNLTSVLQKNDDNKLDKFYLNPEVFVADNLFFFNDVAYGQATDNKDVKYFKTDLDDTNSFTPLGSKYTDEILEQATSTMHRSNLDKSFVSYSKEKDLFVAAYLRYNKVKVLDKEFNEVKTIINGSNEKTPHTSDIRSKENVFYYDAPYAGKNGIYLSYIGKKAIKSNKAQEIHYIDYSGNALVKYVLDFPISNFTIDEEDNKMYCITTSEENQFVVYDL